MLTKAIENDWGPATINITQVGNFTEAPYVYKLTPLEQVEAMVKAGAGLGKV
jgi:pectate lyase